MSYDLDVLVPVDRPIPNSEQLKTAVNELENVGESQESQENRKGKALWLLEYNNPDTGVSFAFKYTSPSAECISQRAWETGLQICVPTNCPTFVARESFPIVERFAKKFALWLALPNGSILDSYTADQLQANWTESNRRAVIRISSASGQANRQSFYFPQDKLDEMWRYLSSRQALLKRYAPLKVYVPRVLLMRNKLNRGKAYRIAMWEDLAPSVIPDVDAFIIGKPKKIQFGIFPSEERTPVCVPIERIADIIEPHLRNAPKPIPHRLIENTKPIKLAIYKRMQEHLNFLMTDYENLYVEEVIDVTLE